MLRSFIAFLHLTFVMILLLLPATLIVVGFVFGRTFLETCILVCSGLLLSRLFHPISVLVGNDSLKF